MSKILLLDIEMAPNVAHVWGIWDQNIGLNQLQESSYVMCYAAKWLGDKKMIFDSVKKSGDKKMLAGIHKLLDEADAVIHYNGKRFDIPSLNKEFLLHGMFFDDSRGSSLAGYLSRCLRLPGGSLRPSCRGHSGIEHRFGGRFAAHSRLGPGGGGAAVAGRVCRDQCF